MFGFLKKWFKRDRDLEIVESDCVMLRSETISLKKGPTTRKERKAMKNNNPWNGEESL